MKIVFGWSLICVTAIASQAWGQEAQNPTAQPRAVNQAPGSPARNAERAEDRADEVRAPGGRRVQGQPGAQAGRQEGQPGAQRSQMADAQIAALLAAGNRNEIEISKFVQDKLQTDEAKDFAAMMIKEHTPVHQRMQQLAGQAARGGGQRRPGGAANSSDAVGGAERGVAGREEVGDEAVEAVRRPSEGVAGGQQQRRGGGGLNWMAFHRELADQCLESTKELLSQQQGIELDKAYLGQQIVAHQEMVDKLTVLQKQASSELQQELQQQLKSAQDHLEQVKKLMDQKKDKEPGDAQRPRNQ